MKITNQACNYVKELCLITAFIMAALYEFIENKACPLALGERLSKFVGAVSLFEDSRCREEIQIEPTSINPLQNNLSIIENGFPPISVLTWQSQLSSE